VTAQQRQAELRRKHKLPYRCECGGLMEYSYDMGRVWSGCKTCTPVVKINLNKLKLTRRSTT
jgi:hypothetical protein